MAKLFCMMGKSASGKDTIYKAIVADKSLNLHTVVPYTTRPIRQGEAEGVEYWFVNETEFLDLKSQGKIIEDRAYNTVHGVWRYFTVDDGQIDLNQKDYIVIGTLEAYMQMKAYFGEKQVVPIYIDLEDGQRLDRALQRERQQTQPKYAELCRRFLADSEDFSKDRLEACGITKAYENNQLSQCILEVKADILKYIKQ